MLCEGAMMVALAQVLSYIKLMELPNGGSLTPPPFPAAARAQAKSGAPKVMQCGNKSLTLHIKQS